MPNEEQGFDWTAVIARCLAYLCLKNSKFADSQLLAQSAFLERLGLPVSARADVLGSTRDSLAVLARRAKKKRGAKKSGKGKRR